MRATMILAALVLAACGGGSDGPPNPAPAANTPPTANAGPAQYVTNGDTVTLAATGLDADGDPVTYAWTLQPQQPGSAAVLIGADTQTPSFTADSRLPGSSYIALLRVSDGKDQAFSAVTITATPIGVTLLEADSGGVDQPVSMPFVKRPVQTLNTPDPVVTLARYNLIVRGVGAYAVQGLAATAGAGWLSGLTEGQALPPGATEFSIQAGHTAGATVQTATFTFGVAGQSASGFDYRATLTTN